MSQKPVKAFLQIPTVRLECGIGCLGHQTVHQVRISHCHGSHKYTSVYYRSAHRYQSLPSGKPCVFLLEREVEGINCNHCMKLMSIFGEIGICYTRKRTLDFSDAIYLNIAEVCIYILCSYNWVIFERERKTLFKNKLNAHVKLRFERVCLQPGLVTADSYLPPTKLREGNILTGVCHSVQGEWVYLVPGPFWWGRGGCIYAWSQVPIGLGGYVQGVRGGYVGGWVYQGVGGQIY